MLAAAARHYADGEFERAKEACYKAAATAPDHPVVLLILGEVLLAAGNLESAAALLHRAVMLKPENGLAHFMLGRALHLSRDNDAARDAYCRAVELEPNMALAHSNLAILLLGLGQLKAAWDSAGRAIDIDPNFVDAHMTLGRVLASAHRFLEAEAAFKTVIRLDPDHVEAHTALGGMAQHQSQPEDAIAAHQRAIALDPRTAQAWAGLGQTLLASGQFEDAADCLRKAIKLEPNYAEAHRALAMCARAGADDPELEQMCAILASPELTLPERASAGYAAGKRLDDMARYDEAFACYAEANRFSRQDAFRQGHRFNPMALHREISAHREIINAEYFRSYSHSGIDSEVPVFVVGLFRSGTTLTEQILASHPAVHGAGELIHMRRLTSKFGGRPGPKHDWNSEALHTAASEHLQFLMGLKPGALRVIDKHPQNVFSGALIASLFPKARVIFCHRDAADNALSCFFQKFAHAMVFSTDLRECGIRHIETERMAAHWRQVLPIKTLDVQYEALVADLEGQARRLIDFLGLEWDPACLNFHETKRAVNTPSTWQVRQPIYATSVGRSRNYEHHLGPLYEVLTAAKRSDLNRQ